MESTQDHSLQQQVMVFLYVISWGCSQRNAAYFFGISQRAVSSIVRASLNAFRELHREFVGPPDKNFIRPEITPQEGLRAFHGCTGAIDRQRINAYSSLEKIKRFSKRRNIQSQNLMCVVRFDGTFSYVLPEEEEAIFDPVLIRYALSNGFGIPARRFYLGSAEIGLLPGVLTPYPDVRYHLKEWHEVNSTPQTKEELFNLRHSRLRTTVELTFGPMRGKFRILRSSASEYNFRNQVLMVYACTGIWNFIKAYDDSQGQRSVDQKEAAFLEVVRN